MEKKLVNSLRIAAFFMVSALVGLAWGYFTQSDKCLYDVCLGAPSPGFGKFARAVRSNSADGSAVLIVDIANRVPFADLVHFRPEFKTPVGAAKITTAQLRVGEDEEGYVDRLQLSVEFAKGSYFWSPTQQAQLSARLKQMLGDMGEYQSVNWMHQYTWYRLDRLRGTRTVVRVWPGTGGMAALRIDMGAVTKVPAPTK